MGFRIGDIVMRMDGDKRPHKIVDITVHYPLNRNEHTFFMYHYEDGGLIEMGLAIAVTKENNPYKD